MVFTSTSNTYKLRVRDGDSNYLNNTGYVVYDLYKAISNNYTPPGPGTTTPAPAEWVIACNEKYSRPGGYITRYPFDLGLVSGSIPMPMVGEWIDYLRNAITFYFAWCPQHTDALKSIGDVAMNKDPMATIVDMVYFVKSIQALMESYMASGGSAASVVTSQEPGLFGDTATIGQVVGGCSGPDAPVAHGAGAWDLFTIGTFDPATNFWFGGKIDLATSVGAQYSSESDAYVGVCTEKFYSIFGIFATTFCGAIGMMRYSDVINWVLLVLDLFVAVWFIAGYIPGYCKKTWALLSGNKGAIQRIAGR